VQKSETKSGKMGWKKITPNMPNLLFSLENKLLPSKIKIFAFGK
jgi:hypothetical protein